MKVRVGKGPVDKPISDKRIKQRIRVSGNPESPSMFKKNKEVAKQKDEEQSRPEEPS